MNLILNTLVMSLFKTADTFHLGDRVVMKDRKKKPYNELEGTILKMKSGWALVQWDGYDDPIEEHLAILTPTGERALGKIGPNRMEFIPEDVFV